MYRMVAWRCKRLPLITDYALTCKARAILLFGMGERVGEKDMLFNL